MTERYLLFFFFLLLLDWVKWINILYLLCYSTYYRSERKTIENYNYNGGRKTLNTQWIGFEGGVRHVLNIIDLGSILNNVHCRLCQIHRPPIRQQKKSILIIFKIFPI